MSRIVEFTAVGAPAEEGIRIICLNFGECETSNIPQGLTGMEFCLGCAGNDIAAFAREELHRDFIRDGDADEKLDRKGQKWEEDIRKKKKKRQSNYMKN